MIVSIWIGSVIIQVMITGFLARQFAKYQEKINQGSNKLSIVIAAHNEFSNLKFLIPSLLEQDYPLYEVIVALDRSNDGSIEFLNQLDSQTIKVVEITQVEEGYDPKKFALTKAIEHATGDWLVFIDADCYPSSSKWLRTMNDQINANTQIILGISPYQSNGSLLQNLIQFEGFVTAFNYISMALWKKPYMGVGRNMAIERKYFNENEGYESFKQITGGDDDIFIQKFANQKNTAVSLGTNALTFTNPSSNWKEYVAQKTRHLSVGSKYSSQDKIFHMIFHVSHLLVWLLLAFISVNLLPIILIYLLVKWIGYRFASSKLGTRFNYIWFPLVDVMYAILIPLIALRSKFVKDIRWKN